MTNEKKSLSKKIAVAQRQIKQAEEAIKGKEPGDAIQFRKNTHLQPKKKKRKKRK